MTSAIDAHEERHRATCDLPGAYLNTKLDPDGTGTDEKVIMLMKGKLAELLVQINPTMYRKYVTTNSKG